MIEEGDIAITFIKNLTFVILSKVIPAPSNILHAAQVWKDNRWVDNHSSSTTPRGIPLSSAGSTQRGILFSLFNSPTLPFQFSYVRSDYQAGGITNTSTEFNR